MSAPPRPAAPDFLDRLVARARGEDSGLRPRLPSFFEPTRPVHVDPVGDAESGWLEEGQPQRVARAESIGTMEPAAPVADARSPEATAPAREPRRPPRSWATPLQTTPPDPPLAGHATRVRRVLESPDVSEETHGLGLTPARPPALNAAVAAVVGDPAPVRDPQLAARGPAEVRSSSIATSIPAAERPRRASVAEPARDARLAGRPPVQAGVLVPAVTPAVRTALVEAQAPHRRAVAEAKRLERAEAADPPVVNVTIGRVEVRAVPAPAVSPPRRPDAPRAMSLAEYLERRGAGR